MSLNMTRLGPLYEEESLLLQPGNSEEPEKSGNLKIETGNSKIVDRNLNIPVKKKPLKKQKTKKLDKPWQPTTSKFGETSTSLPKY